MSEAKSYLSRLKRKRIQIATLEKEIDQLEDIVYNPLKAVTYDRDVVQTSHTGSEGTDRIDELVDMRERLIKTKASLMKCIDTIREEIWLLPSVHHMELLSAVYVEGLTLSEAAESMGRSYESVRHMHGAALAEFQRVVLDPRKEDR